VQFLKHSMVPYLQDVPEAGRVELWWLEKIVAVQ
jgi:hypothetical protein